MGKVYSYTRFSTPEQAAGDSYRRQTEAARRWAEARGLVLDDRLSFADEGVSAYRGTNTDTDKGLGAFLYACKQGLVEPDSYLLVESLDRISRMSPRKAQRVLDDIVDSGITIVTLNDGQEYTSERLESDPTAMLISLMVAWRAHEESKTKGMRVAAAWAQKRARLRTGEEIRFTGKAPGWLRWKDDSWQLVEGHTQTVQRIFRMTLDGAGEHAIAKALNESGVPVMGRGIAWHRSTVAKLLRNPAVIGKLTPGRIEYDTNGKRRRVTEEPVAGVFPAAITEEDWLAVRAMKDGSSTRPRGRGAAKPLQSLFAGLARCPDCGAAMTRVFKGKKGGKPKLVCTMAKVGKAPHYVSVSQEQVEETFWSDWQGLLRDVPAAPADDHLNRLVGELTAAIDAKEDHLAEIQAELEQRPSGPALRAARRMEEELRSMTQQLAEVEERREMADRGMVTMRLDGLRTVIETEDGHAEIARVNAALRVLFSGITIDHRTGQLRFHWKQGGETSLVYAWVDQPT
jgi:DNA invertase Pin-like site-specific DNA recombinase